MKRLLVGTVCLSVVILATQASNAYEFKIVRTTTKNKSVIIGNFISVVNEGCITRPGIVQVIDAPASGRLKMRTSTARIGGGPGVIDRCIGLNGKANVVTYIPNTRFLGTETMRFHVTFSGPESSEILKYLITVQVKAASPAKRGPSLRERGWYPPR